MSPLTDDDLMRRVSAGDADAFTGLYERHKGRVFTYLLRLSVNRHVAEDLLQETWLRVYRARASYEPTGRFQTWLFTIARRLLLDHVRRAPGVWASDIEVTEALRAPERAEHGAEAKDLLHRVDRALAALPPGQREVVLLARFGGLTAEEVATATGSTPGAVRVALHRALQQLRTLIGE